MTELHARSASLPRSVAATLFVAGTIGVLWRGFRAVFLVRQWISVRQNDPSAAELYQVAFWFEVAYVAIAAAIAFGAWRLWPRDVAQPADTRAR